MSGRYVAYRRQSPRRRNSQQYFGSPLSCTYSVPRILRRLDQRIGWVNRLGQARAVRAVPAPPRARDRFAHPCRKDTDEENRSASARCPAENYLDELDARVLAAYRTMVLSRQADEWAVNAFLARWGRIRSKLLAGNSCEGYLVLKPLARWVLRAYTD